MIKINNGLIVNDIYVPRPSTLAKAVKTQEFKDFNVTENGFYVITPDEGFGKMKQVNLNVDVPASGGGCNLGQLNADFTDLSGDGGCWWYPHEQGLDGFNYVKINASQYGQDKYNQGFADGQNAGGGGTGVINMADKGVRFFHFNGENLDGYDFSTVTDFTRFFGWMPQLRSDLNLTFNTAQTMDNMFEFVASEVEEGVEINIDFNNQICFNFTHVFNGSRLKRFPRFTNMNDETWIENYRPFGNCHIHNFDNWQEFPWNRLRGEGGNNLFANMDNLVEVPDIDLSNVEVANGMFSDCTNLERVESLNLQNVGAFSMVFNNCPKLTYIGDLGNFENCWQFDNPFEGCPNLIQLPRMHNLKKSLNLSNMVQMDAGIAGLFLKNDVYNFAENGVERQDGEGVLTVPAYFNDNEFWLAHRDGITDRGWTIEYI